MPRSEEPPLIPPSRRRPPRCELGTATSRLRGVASDHGSRPASAAAGTPGAAVAPVPRPVAADPPDRPGPDVVATATPPTNPARQRSSMSRRRCTCAFEGRFPRGLADRFAVRRAPDAVGATWRGVALSPVITTSSRSSRSRTCAPEDPKSPGPRPAAICTAGHFGARRVNPHLLH